MKKLLTILLLILRVSVNAATYYVSTSGNDNNTGTISQPWATWQKAFDTAEAGDTVYFRGGTWYRQQSDATLTFNPTTGHGSNGTDSDPIVFMGYPPDLANGDTAIYDCRNYVPPGNPFVTTYNAGLNIANCEYIVFKNFAVRNVYQFREYVMATGMAINDCKNITCENLHISNISGIGIFSSTPAPPVTENVWHFKNIDAYNCIDSFAINEYNYNLGQAGSWGVGLFITASEFTRVIIDGCRAWNNADDGINTNPGGQIVLKNCWSFSNGVYLSRISYQTAGNGYKLNGAYEEACDNPERVLHIVYNNISAFNHGQGYTENSNGLPYMYRFNYNNISYKNEQNGFAIQGNRPDTCQNPRRDNQYINNVSFSNIGFNWGEFQGGEAKTEIYNAWNNPPNVTASIADYVYQTDAAILSLLKAPRQANWDLPSTHPFSLISGSDLIDVGFDVTDSLAKVDEVYRFAGSAPDLGPSEFYNKKVVFIHHSSGGNWVADAWGGLGSALNDSGYFFSGIDYGWDATQNIDIGNHTDIGNWWTWFMDQTVQGNSIPRRDNIMGSVYTEYDKDIQFGDYTRTVTDLGGENQIIMFKSCYPNSDILVDNPSYPITSIYGQSAGHASYTESNVRALYDTILTYFKANQGRMFVVITAPPLSSATNAARARSFNNWLVNNWLQDNDWVDKNVYVWDWYNVLTDVDNHHWVVDGVVTHVTDAGSGNVAIDTYIDTDDHPNALGCQKSTDEFLPVLETWYNTWSNSASGEMDTVVVPPSTATNITAFVLSSQTGSATINSTAHTVSIQVAYGTNVTSLSPTITVSAGATISPTSGTARNFTSPLTYTVTAEDGTTTQAWTVTVSIGAAPEVPATPTGTKRVRLKAGSKTVHQGTTKRVKI